MFEARLLGLVMVEVDNTGFTRAEIDV